MVYQTYGFWAYSAKRAGVKRACPNKAMAHTWFMHDARLGRAFLFLNILAEYALLLMTVMVFLPWINSVQTRCIVKGEAQKSPLFWRFSRGF